MATEPADSPQAVKCRQMAANARDEPTRNYWLAMAEFWLSKGVKEPAPPTQSNIAKM